MQTHKFLPKYQQMMYKQVSISTYSGSFYLTTEGVSTSSNQFGPYYTTYRYYHSSIPLLILGIKGMQAQPINFKYIIEVDSIQTTQFSLNITINKN